MRTILICLVLCIGLTNGRRQFPFQQEEAPNTDYRPFLSGTAGLCLDEEEEQMRFANESCSIVSDCFNSFFNTSACKNGMCTCGENFVIDEVQTASGNRRLVCVSAPDANMTCTTTCVKPYVCADPPASSDFAPQPTMGIAVGEMNPMNPKICQCLAPYVHKDYACVLECQPGESYYDGKCMKNAPAMRFKLMMERARRWAIWANRAKASTNAPLRSPNASKENARALTVSVKIRGAIPANRKFGPVPAVKLHRSKAAKSFRAASSERTRTPQHRPDRRARVKACLLRSSAFTLCPDSETLAAMISIAQSPTVIIIWKVHPVSAARCPNWGARPANLIRRLHAIRSLSNRLWQVKTL
jgi:hypothetical protein